jgi:myo-inositol 2-dehydrogenase/D-chiro-inositol 1-dehydrogenase
MKTYAHASWHFPFERFEVYGMHSTYETFEMEKISFTNGLETRTTTYDFSLATMHEKWGYIEEDRLFVDALDGKAAAAVTADDGYNVVELIEACYRSAREGARVRLGSLVGKTLSWIYPPQRNVGQRGPDSERFATKNRPH